MSTTNPLRGLIPVKLAFIKEDTREKAKAECASVTIEGKQGQRAAGIKAK